MSVPPLIWMRFGHICLVWGAYPNTTLVNDSQFEEYNNVMPYSWESVCVCVCNGKRNLCTTWSHGFRLIDRGEKKWFFPEDDGAGY